MKKVKLILIALVMLTITASVNTSCEGLVCNGKGTLQLTNKSLHTVQKVMINNVNYGTLDPGEKKDYELSPGVYAFQQVGISGGTGCSVAAVTISECDTQGFSCSSK